MILTKNITIQQRSERIPFRLDNARYKVQTDTEIRDVVALRSTI